MSDDLQAKLAESSELANRLFDEIRKAVIGQDRVVREVLLGLLASGHVLIEGVPGLGKTLLVRALAQCFDGTYSRIQFTPDLMPSDVTGHSIFNSKTESFEVRRGPVFTNLLLADEINRAPAKTQAALLEVMQERQVTIDGTPFTTDAPFMVLATQNPIEQDGTYPLPEAELDRFMMKILMDFPAENDEGAMVDMVTTGRLSDTLNVQELETILSAQHVVNMQKLTSLVAVDREVLSYAVRIVRRTRDTVGIYKGAGPRASIALVRIARAQALMNGRTFTLPDDVREASLPALRHRIQLAPDLEIEGTSVDDVLSDLMGEVEAPRA
ncbi:MAG: MoxR family ATPase [Gammaproteobacteria bacterium]|nr:MoxR family ATPase [Gammaproteobacteria bacterium]